MPAFIVLFDGAKKGNQELINTDHLKIHGMEIKGYKKFILAGIIIIALGVVLSNSMEGSLGTVLIAVGGLLFIVGMDRKRKDGQQEK